MAYRTVTQRCATIVQDEVPVGVAVKPGHMIDIYNVAGVKKVLPHGIAGGNASPMFACENEFEGKDIADAYVAGEHCIVRTFRSGDLVAARVVTGQTLVFGTKLESAGTGCLTTYGTDTPSAGEVDAWVASAEEVVTTTTETLVLVRIR